MTERPLKQRFTQPITIRAAYQGMIVLAGLVLVLADAEGRGADAPAADNASIFDAARKAVADGKTAQTEQIGFSIGRTFRETRSEGAVLVGFIVGVGKSNQVEAVFTFRAIYLTAGGEEFGQLFGMLHDKREGKRVLKSRVDRTVTLRAKEGYAVGGMYIRGGLLIEGICVHFARIKGSALDPKDTYSSEWLGNQEHGREGLLDSKGSPVIGFFGIKNETNCLALGLIYIASAKSGKPPEVPNVRPRPPSKLPKRLPPDDPRVLPELPPERVPPQPVFPEAAPSPPQPAAEPFSVNSAFASQNWMSFAAAFGFVALTLFALLYFVLQKKPGPPIPVRPQDRPAAEPAKPAGALVPKTAVADGGDQSGAITEFPNVVPVLSKPLEKINIAMPAARSVQKLDDDERPDVIRVSFGPRLGAYVIDMVAIMLGGLVIGLIGSAIGAEAGTKTIGSMMQPGSQPGMPPMSPEEAKQVKEITDMAGRVAGGVFGGVIATVIGILVMPCIFLVWEALTGATIGKRMLKLRIQAADGRPASAGSLWLRALIKYSPSVLQLAGMALALPGLGAGASMASGMLSMVSWLAALIVFVGCLLALGETRLALHDMAAGTAVFAEE